MNLIAEHVAYLKDNPNGYWFKRKLYGWGWTPARWQGWLALLIYLAVVLHVIATFTETASETLFIIGIATLVFVAITIKTGEPAKWQWGRDTTST